LRDFHQLSVGSDRFVDPGLSTSASPASSASLMEASLQSGTSGCCRRQHNPSQLPCPAKHAKHQNHGTQVSDHSDDKREAGVDMSKQHGKQQAGGHKSKPRRGAETAVTSQPTPETQLRKPQVVLRDAKWAPIRSLHYRSGHWAAPIRFIEKQWRSYASTDAKFGPWRQEVSMMSINARGIRNKLDADDVLEMIEDQAPHLCCLQGVSGGFAGMLMENPEIQRRYWVQLGNNLGNATPHL